MSMFEPLVQELEQEAAATRRFLERLPADKLDWKPHDKSMTLGQLALHVAGLPAAISDLASLDSFDAKEANFTPASPESVGQIMSTLEESLHKAKATLSSFDDNAAMATWTLTKGSEEKFSIPRIAMVRSLMLNHLYHHRGQLAVYLRMLDVPVPATYVRSADESPMDL